MSAHPIAVVGARGQIARALQREGARRASNLVVAGRPVIDIASRASVTRVLDGIAPAIVINAAAFTDIDKAERDERAALSVNRDGPHYLAKWCAANDVPLIHLSTGHVFDGTKPTAYHETDACRPLTAYGRSKLAGEDAVRDVLVEHVIVRTAWVYSADGDNGLKAMVRRAGEKGVIEAAADQTGTPTSADDIAAALLDVSDAIQRSDGCSDREAPWGTYHLAAGGETTWHGFAHHIFSIAANNNRAAPRVEPILTGTTQASNAEPKYGVLNTEKICRAFGVALPPWQESVAACVRRLMADGMLAQNR